MTVLVAELSFERMSLPAIFLRKLMIRDSKTVDSIDISLVLPISHRLVGHCEMAYLFFDSLAAIISSIS
jgi:hypothetical protein